MTQAERVSTTDVRPVVGVRYFFSEVVAALWTPFRLVLRHWPVLLTLAVGGVIAREALIRASIWSAKFSAMLGLLVFMLAPVAMMASMVLMLRSVRPSLPTVRHLDRPGSVLRDLGSVLIPFVAFYLAFGLFEKDYREYSDGLYAKYESFGALFENPHQPKVRVPLVTESGANILPLLGVVAVAFLLRWALDKWKLTRRNPVLGIPGAYFESIWVLLGGLYVIKQWVDGLEIWAGERKAWHAVLDWWHGPNLSTGSLGQLYRTVNDWLVAAFPSGDFTRILFVPITGLVATAVVYNLTVSDVLRPPAVDQRWLRSAAGGVSFAVSRRFGPLIQGVRAMGRSGAVPVMFFCLCVVALQVAAQWLRKAEWASIGPRPLYSVQDALNASIEGLNDVLTFVLLMCVLAAAADGVARRNGRTGAGPAPVPAPVADSPRGEPDVVGQHDGVVDADRDGLRV